MNQPLNIAALCVVFFAAGLTVQAKDWRGISPLVSTREDVISLLGESQRSPMGHSPKYSGETDAAVYFLPDGDYKFSYAPRLDERRVSLPTSIRPGVLLSIRISPAIALTWSEAKLDQSAFRRYGREKQNENWNEGYVSDSEGVILSLVSGKIGEMVFIPRQVDRGEAAEYYRGTASFVPVFDHSPGAGISVTLCREEDSEPGSCDKARLDDLALQLQEAPDAQGYIVMYVARSGGNYKELADRLVDYLVNHRKIDRGRLIVLDGGFSDEFYYDLVCVPVGGNPPTPTAFNNLPKDEVPGK
ncbi:MAG: hypothetical protein ABIP75_16025 [Pyrinomonadaceae bacterium]